MTFIEKAIEESKVEGHHEITPLKNIKAKGSFRGIILTDFNTEKSKEKLIILDLEGYPIIQKKESKSCILSKLKKGMIYTFQLYSYNKVYSGKSVKQYTIIPKRDNTFTVKFNTKSVTYNAVY